jgi:hypothetical protein
MTRSRCFYLCACLSLTAAACGSSTSTPSSTGTSTTTSTASSASWDQARIGHTGTSWWINAQKGAFFFSVQLHSAYIDDTAATTKALDISITQKAVAKVNAGATALSTIPALSEMPGSWSNFQDNDYTKNGPVTSSDFAVDPPGTVTLWIDGGMDPFFTDAYKAKALAFANYVTNDASVKDDPYVFELRFWQMASATDAAKVYSDLLSNSYYSTTEWANCSATACPYRNYP